VKTYKGRCHCGAARFEIDADIDHVRECDCSVCSRRGALTFRVSPNAIRFSTSLDRLSVYRWGTGPGADYFCPTCGVMPFRRPSAPTQEELNSGASRFDGWAVNAKCIEGLALESLPRVRVPGSDLKI
jgi:hypothetical protein